MISLLHEKLYGIQCLDPQPYSARLLLGLAAMNEFEVWSPDLKLAYLQSTELLLRRVFIKNPAPEFELEPHECFELQSPLYGLCDSVELWLRTLENHLMNDLGVIATKADTSPYFSFRSGKLVDLNGSFVEDLLRADDREFHELCSCTHMRFETSGDDDFLLTFAGFKI